MIEEARSTKIAGEAIAVTVCKYETVAEFVNVVEEAGGDGQEALLNAINAMQVQNSMQSPKGAVRESEDPAAALMDFPGNVYKFRYKGAEGSRKGDGITQKQSQASVRHLAGAIAGMDDADALTIAEINKLLTAEGKGVSL